MKSVLWEICHSPTGAPAPYFVISWEGEPGGRPVPRGEPIFAASVELAKQACPANLVWSPPSNDRRQPRGILEIGTEPPK